jgi:peptidoglycan/xylan/chitin deacetylase (PgdA/CDA1 family)
LSYLTKSQRASRRESARRRAQRRRAAALVIVLGCIAVVVAIALSGTSGPTARPDSAVAPATRASIGGAVSQPSSVSHHHHDAAPRLPAIAAAAPGAARVFTHGPPRPEVALTIDDGFCTSCVARIVRGLIRTGAHATIFPNGTYGASWDPQAAAIRRLIAKGQIQVGNHTFLHHDALLESSAAFQTDLSRNEAWIEQTFGVTARPFFRPPYGAYNSGTLAIAGQLGYTKVIMWSGTVADSSVRSVPYILAAIKHWAHPGAIILMHGNYPATSLALPQIIRLLKARGLEPVTLRQLLG